jgi:hypothetical protein
MDSAILYISSRHCKHCETIMKHIDPSQIRIVDVSMQGSTVPTYIEEVPTITFEGRMYVGVENALHIINSSLKHIVNPYPKKGSNVESIHPNQMVSKDNKIKGAALYNNNSLMATPLSGNPKPKINLAEGFGELLPSQLKHKTAKLSSEKNADLKSSYEKMMKARNKIRGNEKHSRN